MRLSSNPAVVGGTISVAAATTMLAAIRTTRGHEFIADASSLADPAIDLTRVATSGQITDAHLVNLAAANAAVLATMDAGIPHMLAPADRAHVLVIPRED